MDDNFNAICSINSKILLVTGGVKTEKFYNSCRKIVAACLEDCILCAVYCNNLSYARNILCDICGGEIYANGSIGNAMWFNFKNGSRIDLWNDVALNIKELIEYNMSVLKEPSSAVFVDFSDNTTNQVIVTCTPNFNQTMLAVINAGGSIINVGANANYKS